jgi:Predicted transcriptional regulators
MKNRIQELRREYRITQEDLAERCRVTRQTIISLESGKYNPSIFLAYKIARVFGLSIEQVFIFEEEE